MNVDSPRAGDIVLVEAIVRQYKGQKPTVHFKNGDNLPLSSVVVKEVSHFDLTLNDRIMVGGKVGTVRAVLGESGEVIWRHRPDEPAIVSKMSDVLRIKTSPIMEP